MCGWGVLKQHVTKIKLTVLFNYCYDELIIVIILEHFANQIIMKYKYFVSNLTIIWSSINRETYDGHDVNR